ncbi:MAG: hypothetical protein HEEMFOPI_00841 [Holosporales bacterium]
MDRLAAYFRSLGGDVNRVFAELNEQGRPAAGSVGATLPQEISTDGGRLTCVLNDKIAVDTDPQNLGKDATSILKNTKEEPFLPYLIAQLRKNPQKEDVVTYALLQTDAPNPEDNSKMLSERFVVVAKGRKALLGSALDKQHHQKFACYVAYPVK